MSFRNPMLLLAVAALLTSGCRAASLAHHPARPQVGSETVQSESAPETIRADVPAPAQSAEDESRGTITPVSAQSSDEISPETSIEPRLNHIPVRAAIEMALTQNPDLIALRQNDPVGMAAIGVAKTYPFNPWVQFQATPYQRNEQGNTGSMYHYVLLMQQIQLGGQQKYREEAACSSLNSIRWNLLQAELLNVVQTERFYFTAVYQQGLYKLARINAENNQQLLETLVRQQEAGQATAADVAIVRLDARSTRQQQRVAQANLETALLDLKRHLRLPADYLIDVDEHVASWTWLPADEYQLTSLALSRPDVMAARADTVTARANTSFANSSRIPDLQIGPYYQRDDFGTVYLGFRAHQDIPVLNNGMPLLRQRQAEFCQRAMISQELAARASLEAAAAAKRYERARQMKLEASEPSATVPVELKNLEEQFKANEVDILRVMQARNSIIQAQRADLDGLNELLQAAVTVTAASGAPIELLTGQEQSQPAEAE